MSSLYTGSALYICRNNKDMFRDVAVFKPTIMVLVPALAGSILHNLGAFVVLINSSRILKTKF